MGILKIDPRMLNLVFSSALLLAGLGVHWIWHPRRFHEHSFLERAFEFWVLKWLLFVVTYGLLTVNTDLRFVLAAIDLNTTIGIGFIIAVWKGDAYDAGHTKVNLLFLFGLLFAWNFVGFPLGGKLWILPSMTFALVTLLGTGVAVFARFGMPAISFVVVTVVYGLLQMPGYQALFIDKKSDQELINWLAFAKLLYGGIFYPVFFSAISTFDALHVPKLPVLTGRVRKVVTGALAAIGGGLLTEGTLWLGKLLWRTITGHAGPA